MVKQKLVHQLKNNELLSVYVQAHDAVFCLHLSGNSLNLLEKGIFLNLANLDFRGHSGLLVLKF